MAWQTPARQVRTVRESLQLSRMINTLTYGKRRRACRSVPRKTTPGADGWSWSRRGKFQWERHPGNG